MLAGCASLPSGAEVRDRAAAFSACPPAGLQVDLDAGPGWSTPDGSIGVGPITTRFVFPDSPDWKPRPPVPEEILHDPSTWRSPANAAESHRALRSRLARPAPSGSTQVRIFERSDHWTRIETSLVATRGPDGAWQVDEAHEWNVGTGREENRTRTWTLSEDYARRLDGLLADRCLNAEPRDTEYSEVTISTAGRWTLEVLQPGKHLVIGGGDLGFGRVGEIYHLVTHREPQP